MKAFDLTQLRFDESGLISAIVQDAENGQVLMLAYMNQQSLQMTLETGLTHFYSRSRQRIWQKGKSPAIFSASTRSILTATRMPCLLRLSRWWRHAIPADGPVFSVAYIPLLRRRRS